MLGGGNITRKQQELGALGFAGLPAIISAAGERPSFWFIEFFTANIRNPNTRVSYGRAVREFFAWCEDRGFSLEVLNPVIVAGYIGMLGQPIERHGRVQIFATDIDERGPGDRAQRALPREYRAARDPSAWSVSSASRTAFTMPSGNCANASLFSNHSFIKDPPFSRLDLICCLQMAVGLRWRWYLEVSQAVDSGDF